MRTDAFYRPNASTLHKPGDEVVLYVYANVAGIHAANVDAVPAHAVVDVVIRNRYGIVSGACIDQDPGPASGEAACITIRYARCILFQAERLNDNDKPRDTIE